MDAISDSEEESEESESEDDEAEELTNAMELKILKTIHSIREKDPKIYHKEFTWFDEEQQDDEGREGWGYGWMDDVCVCVFVYARMYVCRSVVM